MLIEESELSFPDSDLTAYWCSDKDLGQSVSLFGRFVDEEHISISRTDIPALVSWLQEWYEKTQQEEK